MRPAALAATLSGRADERARLLDVVRAGLAGSPRAVLVHGEAGIGKTSLVRNVCHEVRAQGAQVLWGQSLRFGAVEAMYHPLVLALEGWLAQADDSDRATVIEAAPAAALILPSLGAAPAEGPSALMMVVDALFSRVITLGPTVLVVDDVQWADPATWDALAYLVAGFANQQLALVTTHRDEAAGSEQFQHWLGNVRRLPGTEELALTRLDQDATGDQIAELLGRPPPPLLVEQVYERSRGNPYFSELLVRRGDLGSDELPEGLPEELSQALLDAWRELSGPAREITRMLAIAGRPSELRILTTIAAALGVHHTGTVRESVEAGVVVLDGDDVWFRHPLLAGVLAGSYLPGEAASVHAAWASRLETVSSDGVDELRRLGDLASHRERAGERSAAFDALLQGANLAEKIGARREAAELLIRAADLWELGADTTDDIARARLLERAAHACGRVHRVPDTYRLFRQAHDLVSPERDPLWASRLTAEVATLGFTLGETQDSGLLEIERVVELSRVDPDSREHAEALATLAMALMWGDRNNEARRMIDEAVAAADRSGSAEAISLAHANRAWVMCDTDLRQAQLDAVQSWEVARTSDEPDVIAAAYGARQVISSARGDLRRAREHGRDLYVWAVAQARPMFSIVYLSNVLLALGDLEEAEAIVRTGLATTSYSNFEANIRLQAAVLAVRRGLDDVVDGHVTRARELAPWLEEDPQCVAGPPIAEVLLAQDDPAAAFELIERVLPLNAVDTRVLDELLVLGARAAADLVQQAADDRDQDAVQTNREALTGLIKARAALPGIIFQPSCSDDTVQPARAALFAAEQGRAEGVDDQVSLWRDAAAACATASLGWEHQLASYRLASAIVESGVSRTEAGELLRGVHDYATRQRAFPLKARVEELADSARISLSSPRIPTSATVPAAFTGLTAREKEVLAYLVANRTNAEIAETLFISEKTVSVHVSNLLRKTATGSRREVAALARRVGWGTGE